MGGGKPIEAFISDPAIQTLAEAKEVRENKEKELKKFDIVIANTQFEKALKKYEVAHLAWVKNGKQGKAPKRPTKKEHPNKSPRLHSTIFNGMIHPIIGYGIQGAIWYQGESNAKNSTSPHYGEFLSSLVSDWRTRWNQDFPFYYVQLASFDSIKWAGDNKSNWVLVQDEMRRALNEIPKTGMAVINDIGSAGDIHPRNKKDVGTRLARWALSKDYGKTSIIPSGPLFKSVSYNENKAIVSFDFSNGLKARDNKHILGFEIAGEDGNWHSATAEVNENTIILKSSSVNTPRNVRYAWKDNPTEANLVNSENLPTSCFTTHHAK